MSSRQFNSKNNVPVLLFKALFGHGKFFLLSVATDSNNGDGLSPTFSSFNAMLMQKSPPPCIFLSRFFHDSKGAFSVRIDLKQRYSRDIAPFTLKVPRMTNINILLTMSMYNHGKG